MTNKIEVVDPADAEVADIVICILVTDPLAFPDNETGPCTKCGRMLQFRPHCPKGPPKYCMECIQPQVEAEAKKGNLHSMITPKTARELVDHFNRKKMH